MDKPTKPRGLSKWRCAVGGRHLGCRKYGVELHCLYVGARFSRPKCAILELGDASFTVKIVENLPWLSTGVKGQSIVVQIDKNGLERGTYYGSIQVNASPGTTIGSPQTIYVHLVVLAGDNPNATPPLYEPSVSR